MFLVEVTLSHHGYPAKRHSITPPPPQPRPPNVLSNNTHHSEFVVSGCDGSADVVLQRRQPGDAEAENGDAEVEAVSGRGRGRGRLAVSGRGSNHYPPSEERSHSQEGRAHLGNEDR